MRVETWKESARMVVPSSSMVSNRILWEWYQRCRACNIPVSGPMLQEEALAIAERPSGKKELKASNGWLEKWKNQHNLAQRNIAGEEGDVNDDTVCSWMERVK